MRFTPGSRRDAGWLITPFFLAACLISATIHRDRLVHAGQEATPSARSIRLGVARPDSLYAITLGVKDPVEIQRNDSIRVTVSDAEGVVGSKWLHAADLDFYLTLRPRAQGPVTVSLSSGAAGHEPEISATLSKILQPSAALPGKSDAVKRGVIAAAPNDTWQSAQPFELGQTIFGSDDERPYAPWK